ncbi:MAG: hypothetical protein WBF66_09815 [Dehalococcoidia bacterium]
MKKAALMAALLSAVLLCLHVGLVAAQTESEPLVAGCNPVTTTYPDATPIATIAGAVTPAEALQSIWQLEAGIWTGYSAQFPAASDLAEVDRLDVVFICMSAAGSFERLVI